jgi:hypothetical protein
MTETETYWKSLWGEKTEYNERAKWLRREQRREISHMDRKTTHITEITSNLSKAHN